MDALPIQPPSGGDGMYDDRDAELMGRWQDLTLVLCGAVCDGLLDRQRGAEDHLMARPR